MFLPFPALYQGLAATWILACSHSVAAQQSGRTVMRRAQCSSEHESCVHHAARHKEDELAVRKHLKAINCAHRQHTPSALYHSNLLGLCWGITRQSRGAGGRATPFKTGSHTREKTLMREVEQHFAKSLPYTNLHQKRLNANGSMGSPRYGHVVHCNVCPPKACLSCLWALFGHSPAHRTVRRTRLREGLKASIAFYHKVHTVPKTILHVSSNMLASLLLGALSAWVFTALSLSDFLYYRFSHA